MGHRQQPCQDLLARMQRGNSDHGLTLDRTAAEGLQLLKAGVVAIKHGRHGKPHPTRLYLSSDDEVLAWERMGGSRIMGRDDRTVAIAAIRAVHVGRESAVFRRASWQERTGIDKRGGGAPEYSLTLIIDPMRHAVSKGVSPDKLFKEASTARNTLDVSFNDDTTFGLVLAGIRALLQIAGEQAGCAGGCSANGASTSEPEAVFGEGTVNGVPPPPSLPDEDFEDDEPPQGEPSSEAWAGLYVPPASEGAEPPGKPSASLIDLGADPFPFDSSTSQSAGGSVPITAPAPAPNPFDGIFSSFDPSPSASHRTPAATPSSTSSTAATADKAASPFEQAASPFGQFDPGCDSLIPGLASAASPVTNARADAFDLSALFPPAAGSGVIPSHAPSSAGLACSASMASGPAGDDFEALFR